jgi:hypothetical protein
MRFTVSFFLLLATVANCQPQPAPISYKDPSVTLSFGASIFQTASDTKFWNSGPGGSTRFMINVSKPVAVGLGVDAAFFAFNEQAFRTAYPNVPVRPRSMVVANVYLAMKCVVMPSMRLSPHVGLTLGATRLSEAIYGETIDSVRVYYYNIPARTTMTVGVSVGAGLYISRWLSLDAEAKSNYIVNNPDLKASFLFLGGFRFTL